MIIWGRFRLKHAIFQGGLGLAPGRLEDPAPVPLLQDPIGICSDTRYGNCSQHTGGHPLGEQDKGRLVYSSGVGMLWRNRYAPERMRYPAIIGDFHTPA